MNPYGGPPADSPSQMEILHFPSPTSSAFRQDRNYDAGAFSPATKGGFHPAATAHDPRASLSHGSSYAEDQFGSLIQEGIRKMRSKAGKQAHTETNESLNYLGYSEPSERLVFDEENSRVQVPHQNYIPITIETLADALLEVLDNIGRDTGCTAERQYFQQLCGLYYYLLLSHYNARNKESHLYETIFNPALQHSSEHLLKQFQRADESTRSKVATRFVDSFVATMFKANFMALTQTEIDFANTPEEFVFGVPVKIDWDQLDSQLLSDYYNQFTRSKPDAPPPPTFARHCLVFWRGVGVSRKTGYFYLQKLDYLLQSVLSRYIGRVSRQVPIVAGNDHQPERTAGATSAGGQRPVTTIHDAQYLERVTLASKRLAFSPSKFFEKVTLQEPTYKEVVLLFKRNTCISRASPKSSRSNKQRQQQEQAEENESDDETEDDDADDKGEEESQRAADSGVFIQRFYDVPMKNLRIVFPVKKAGWNWADLLYTTMLASWIITICFKAFTAISRSTYIDEAVLGILLLCVPLLLRYINRKIAANRTHRLCSNMITSSLQNNSLNCNKSVLSYVRQCAVEQDFKEAIMAYFVIWRWKNGISKQDLDGACEHLLHKSFKLCVDFEVDDALRKLTDHRLIYERDGLYFPMDKEGEDEAIDTLKAKLLTAAFNQFRSSEND